MQKDSTRTIETDADAMYTAYWKLNARPFDNGCDPQFYYPSESHQVTLLKLRYALDHPRGAALLAGVAGLGKSLLVQTLLADLPESFGPLIYVKFPQMSPPQLLALIAEELTGRNMDGATADRSVLAIQRTLSKNEQEGRRAVIVLDEAHLLRDTDALETLRLLMNFAPSWTPLLVAQPHVVAGLGTGAGVGRADRRPMPAAAAVARGIDPLHQPPNVRRRRGGRVFHLRSGSARCACTSFRAGFRAASIAWATWRC